MLQECIVTGAVPQKYLDLQQEVRRFISRHREKSPELGGGRKRPDRKTLDWQRLLVDHGYVGRTVPRKYGGYGAAPDVFEATIVADEFRRANVSPGMVNQGIDAGSHPPGGRNRRAVSAVGRPDDPRGCHLVSGLFGARSRE